MAAQEPEITWETLEARLHACDVANAHAGVDGVTLNFGATWRPDESQAGVAVRMLQQIALRPQTAKNLRDLLARLIADAEAASQRRR